MPPLAIWTSVPSHRLHLRMEPLFLPDCGRLHRPTNSSPQLTNLRSAHGSASDFAFALIGIPRHKQTQELTASPPPWPKLRDCSPPPPWLRSRMAGRFGGRLSGSAHPLERSPFSFPVPDITAARQGSPGICCRMPRSCRCFRRISIDFPMVNGWHALCIALRIQMGSVP